MAKKGARAVDLGELAAEAMRERGLRPTYPREVLRQVEKLPGPADPTTDDLRDLRGLLWCSIDNDDSRDLDQLTYAEPVSDGATRVYVAIADVDALVHKGSPVDVHAAWNTTSVYTPTRIFAMLPERLSTDLTSLNPHAARVAIVVSCTVLEDGSVRDPEVTHAAVRNRAKLAYSRVGPWLAGRAAEPDEVAAVEGLGANLRLQYDAACRLCQRRHELGALVLDTAEARAVLRDGAVADIVLDEKNAAHRLIEDFMIAANGVVATFLEERGFPGFRRIVRTPERWDRIVALAAEYGESLPEDPDPGALQHFLLRRRSADPLSFPDLSLAVIKLLGRGEYIFQEPGSTAEGHFGLAVRDYAHSTAPNRRYPDVITQRLLKRALGLKSAAYGPVELELLARHCTAQEDAAKKVERRMMKSAAAMLLASRVGDTFSGIITGAKEKGVWVRIFKPPVEGRVVEGGKRCEVGDRVSVKLLEVDVLQGFLDFAVVG